MNKVVGFTAFAYLALPGISYGQQSPQLSAGLDLNYKHLSSNFVTVTPPTGVVPLLKIEQAAKVNLWTATFSPSVAWHGAFITAAIERTLGEGTTNVATTTTVGTAGTPSHSVNNGTVSRKENSVTAGYDIWKGVTPFAGYFQNTTDLYSALSNNNFSYREYGPYFGLAYSYGFSGGGRAGISVARARANGTGTSKPGSDTALSMSGTVTGTSYGLSWIEPISNTAFYRIGYKATRYKFKMPNTLFGDLEADQSYDALHLGITKYF